MSRKHHSRFAYTDSFKLLHSGREYYAALEAMIDAARYEIHLQTYIFQDDETGRAIADALIRAAQRGVKVYLLLDGYGSGDLPKAFVKELRDAGIELRWFGKLFTAISPYISRRLHRKLFLVDGKDAIIGGINISNHYNEVNGTLPWLDYAVQLMDFPTNYLYRLCQERWLKTGNKRRFRKSFVPHPPPHHNAGEVKSVVKVNENDYIHRKNQAALSYTNTIRHAHKTLFIVGGYFLPGGRARRLLRRAARRGVDIKIILAEQSDIALNRNAVQYLYQWLIRSNIKIYEYRPANVHGKVMVADQKVVNIGSYDLNNLSTYSNIELNLEIHNAAFAAQFHRELEELIKKDCQPVTADTLYKRSNPWKRFKHWFSYQFLKTLFIMAVWFANRKDNIYQ